jgi:hypothetical protein
MGTFYADATREGKPVRMRFIWSKITPTSCHWEQAFSPDKGVTWETTWVQDIRRVRCRAARELVFASQFRSIQFNI